MFETIGRKVRAWGPWVGAICGGLLLGRLAVADGPAAANQVVLKESLPPGTCTQVVVELKADGLFQPGLPPGKVAEDAKLPKPLSLDVQSRLIFSERALETPATSPTAGPRGKSIRLVSQAASAINGDVRTTSNQLRHELALLVAERKGPHGAVVVVSTAGPMTRAELELVQGVGDPLSLPDLLPVGPASAGQSWKLPMSAALALSDYDSVKSNGLEATLEEVNEQSARIRVKGEVKGTARAGEGTIVLDGAATFDREAGLVSQLELKRTENRQPGPIEAGLDVKSTLNVKRRRTALISELSDKAIANVTLETSPPRQLLQMISPDNKYNILHDRQWHMFWDDPKLVVLKRLVDDRVIAHCNLAVGPSAGPGKHQDLDQFRDDIKRSLKTRFVQFLGAGEVEGDPAGGFRYKVGVQGRDGNLGILWNYFLIASPAGDQVLATFTLADTDAEAFGSQDLELIGSLQWMTPPPPAEKP
jgi:hypothetical protein